MRTDQITKAIESLIEYRAAVQRELNEAPEWKLPTQWGVDRACEVQRVEAQIHEWAEALNLDVDTLERIYG